MRNCIYWTACAVLLVNAPLVNAPCATQKKSRKGGRANPTVSVEAAVTARELDALSGRPAEFELATGKRIADVTLVNLIRGKHKQSVRTVVYRKGQSKTTRKYRPNALKRVIVAEQAYDLVFDAALRSHVLVDVARKTEIVTARLTARRQRLWPPQSSEQRAAVVSEQKRFLMTVGEAFSSLPMRLYETRFFLFYTDMPANQIAGYVAQLDSMNIELGKQFDVLPGVNIWRGKAVFVVFVNQASFVQFEVKFMKKDPSAIRNTQGICHQHSTGNVVVACYRGNDPNYFAQVLVHETTHGYLHRFKSSARVPSWLNEGIAEWVSAFVVRGSRVPQKRQRDAEVRLKQTGLIERSFFGKKIESWHYGVASRITDSLIQLNPRAFRSLVVSIKEGVEWPQGLAQTFGVTPLQLLQAHGRSIGVPLIRLQ